MQSLVEYLKESLLQHISLELKELDPIYEKYGEYNGCKELADYIIELCNKLCNNNSFTILYNDVKNIDNIVFEKLEIELIKDNQYYANYLANETIKLSENGRFKYCKIIIYYENKSDKKTIHSLIEHELTHLYNDYQLQLKGLGTFKNLFDNIIYKSSKEFNSHQYPLEIRELKCALYLFNEYEKNSFIAQLMDEIREIKSSYKDITYIDAQKMYNMIKSLDIYKAYMNIGVFINRFYNNDLTKKEKENIIQEWNNLYTDKKYTIDQIFKSLKTKFINIKNKIETLIPKKIAESIGYYGLDYNVNLTNISQL